MEQWADNGSYAYVDDLDKAQMLFAEDLTSTLRVIALDARDGAVSTFRCQRCWSSKSIPQDLRGDRGYPVHPLRFKISSRKNDPYFPKSFSVFGTMGQTIYAPDFFSCVGSHYQNNTLANGSSATQKKKEAAAPKPDHAPNPLPG
jgi:hypothetical protein